MMPANKLKTLFVVNKVLPDSDYRLAYGEYSQVCDVVYGLPEKSIHLPEEKYVHIGFEEGLHFGVIKALWDLYVYLRRNRKKLTFVHLFTTNPILFGSFAAKLAGVPVVVTLTGFGRVMTSEKVKYRLLRPIYTFFFRFALLIARRIFFQNHADMKTLLKQYPAFSKKFRYVGSTANMPKTNQKNFSTPVLRVFLGTRLLPDKGVGDFIEVARQLHKDGFQFILAGPVSRGFDALMTEIWQAHEDGAIVYKGELDTPQMERELGATHILFFPSHYGEGLSRLMIEAGFSKTCPLAYNIPSNRDLIATGRGFLVESGDLENVIATLKKLRDHREYLVANAEAYQAHILQNFGLINFTQRLDEIFIKMQDKIGA